MKGKHMTRIIIIFAFVLLCGCRNVPLTAGGRNILVISNLDSLPSGCERLEVVVAKAAKGYDQALTAVRNRAGAIPGANTIVINTVEGHTISRRISAVAFNCSVHATTPAATEPQSIGVSKEIIEKAKKCQSKGGIWVNNQCVVQVD